VSAVGRDLSNALGSVLEALPGNPHRPQRLAQALGVNTVLTSRLLKAARHADPLAVAHLMPGPEPLRRLLRAAEKSRIDRKVIERARQAIDRFQDLIDIEAGDRSAFDAIISGWLPDARDKVELIAKQSVFRGASQLLGCACDVEHSTFIAHPSELSSDRADVVSILLTQGLRRVRPGAVIKRDTFHSGTLMLALSGEPIERGRELLLDELCSHPLPEMSIERMRVDGSDVVRCTFEGDSVGTRSAVDLASAVFLPQRKPRYRENEFSQRTSLAVGVAMPCRVLVLDVLLHEELWPDAQPALDVYQTVGVMAAHDPRRHERDDRSIDRLNVHESIEPLGSGLSRLRSSDTQRYPELISHVCAARKWDVETLRGYRCRIEYPMYSSEVVVTFDLPPSPGA
jgi:hypothetical protein